jgi:uncharacterized protein YndB with AHSA1/START domain
MLKMEFSIHIDRPVAEVFEYLADPAKLPEWSSIIDEARPAETPIHVGTKVQTRAKLLGRKLESSYDVIEYEVNKRFVTKTDRPFPLTRADTYQSEGNGTRVVLAVEAEPGGFFRLGEPILARIMKKQVEAELDTVKELLEAEVRAER